MEAVPIAENSTRRIARHAHGHNHDSRARHYALRAVRPSPARVEAPEPDVWLSILDITGELEALDITAELELLDLETARADLTAELTAHETEFWNTAPRRLEEVVALVTFVEPVAPIEPVAPVVPVEPEIPVPTEAPLALVPPAAPAVEPVAPEASLTTGPEPASGPVGLRVWVRQAVTGVDLRTRLVGTVLVIAVLGAFATVLPDVVGASVPQRYVTITLDGRTVARTVRLATVAEVLASEGITIRPGDQVVPGPGTDLTEDMHIRVLRSFPVDVEVNGSLTTVRTTVRAPAGLRRQLGIDEALVASGSDQLAAGSAIAFRTPHSVVLQVDGRVITAPQTTALNVAGLLAEFAVPLSSRDEVMPAPNTRLANGMRVEVFRLAANQVAERVAVPFSTELRDDPNLRAGQTRTIRAGVPGLRRNIFQVTKRNGTVVAKDQIGSELLVPPVSQVVVEGTQPVPPSATGSATWYGTGPGQGTCAHLSLEFGTIVTLTNRDTGATAQCRVADRGPETWTGHIIDLSPDVFRRLAPLSQGIVPNLALSY